MRTYIEINIEAFLYYFKNLCIIILSCIDRIRSKIYVDFSGCISGLRLFKLEKLFLERSMCNALQHHYSWTDFNQMWYVCHFRPNLGIILIFPLSIYIFIPPPPIICKPPSLDRWRPVGFVSIINGYT